MTALVEIIDNPKHLPDQDLERAARYIHQLREDGRQRRVSAIRETAGALQGSAAETFEAAIQECERLEGDDP